MSVEEARPIVADERTGIVRNATREEAEDLEHDGVIGEPGQLVRNVLWLLVVLVLCLAVVALVATLVLLAFTPAEPKAAIDSATLVAVFGTVLASLVAFYTARQRR